MHQSELNFTTSRLNEFLIPCPMPSMHFVDDAEHVLNDNKRSPCSALFTLPAADRHRTVAGYGDTGGIFFSGGGVSIQWLKGNLFLDVNPNRTKGEVMVVKRGVMLLWVLVFCLAAVSPCLAKEGGSKIMGEVKAVMEQHNKAFNAQDLKGVMTAYASDPNTVLMGTGPGEAYVGDEAIGSAYNQLFTRFDANTLSFKYDWICAGSAGSVAWFAVTTTMEGPSNKEKKERAFNMSGTLRKEKGQWRILSMHFSRLGAEQQAAADQPK